MMSQEEKRGGRTRRPAISTVKEKEEEEEIFDTPLPSQEEVTARIKSMVAIPSVPRDEKLIERAEIMRLLGIRDARSFNRLRAKDPTFPPLIELPTRNNLFSRALFEQWLAAKMSVPVAGVGPEEPSEAASKRGPGRPRRKQ